MHPSPALTSNDWHFAGPPQTHAWNGSLFLSVANTCHLHTYTIIVLGVYIYIYIFFCDDEDDE